MKYIKNDYDSLTYVFNKETFSPNNANDFYAKSKKSKSELIQILKDKILNSSDFSKEYKDAILSNKNISICCFYASKYEISVDIYYDKYEEIDNGYVPDAWGGYYKDYQQVFVGRIKHSTLKCGDTTKEYDILKPNAEGYINIKDEDYNLFLSFYTISKAFDKMIEEENEKWLRSVGQSWAENRNQQFNCWHIPFIALKSNFNGKNIISWINANTLETYLGGYYSNDALFKQIYNEAQNGDAEKMYNLGYEYYKGECSTKNPDEAIKWLTLAADKKNAYASSLLGSLYYGSEKQGYKQDDKKAFKYLKFAADKDLKNACFNLANLYKLGIGTNKNNILAINYYAKAKRLGYTNAEKSIENIADNATDGDTLDHAGTYFEEKYDLKKAFKYYEKASKEYNHPDATFNLSNCYNHLSGELSSIYNYETSNNLYQKALTLNSPKAKIRCEYLNLQSAEKYANDKKIRNSPEAIRAYLQVNSENLSPQMKYILAQHYEGGLIVQQDLNKALSLYADCYSIKKGLKELQFYAKQNYAYANYYLSKYYLNKGKKKLAYEELFKAGKLGYDDAFKDFKKLINNKDNKRHAKILIEYVIRLAKMGYSAAISILILYYEGNNSKKYKKWQKLYDKLSEKSAFKKTFSDYDFDFDYDNEFCGKMRKKSFPTPSINNKKKKVKEKSKKNKKNKKKDNQKNNQEDEKKEEKKEDAKPHLTFIAE